MANMETFYKGQMASESVASYLGSGKFKANNEYAEIHDGALVVVAGEAPNDAYNTAGINNVIDDNVDIVEAPAAATDDVVIMDIVDVSGGMIAGNYYKEGIKLVGLKGRPGKAYRYRIPKKNDKYYISADCFSAAPTVGQYAGVAANSTQHTPMAAKPDAGYCVKIIDSKDFTVGATAYGKMYICRVVQEA